MTDAELAAIRAVLSAADPRALSPVMLHVYVTDLLAEVDRLREWGRELADSGAKQLAELDSLRWHVRDLAAFHGGVCQLLSGLPVRAKVRLGEHYVRPEFPVEEDDT